MHQSILRQLEKCGDGAPGRRGIGRISFDKNLRLVLPNDTPGKIAES